MSGNTSLQMKQLAHRLESASSSDRIDALQELQSLARNAPDLVGEYALKKTFDLLREQSSAEEYAEALDLTSKLIKCRDKKIALANTKIILEDVGNVELLLDLLEHNDLTVGVMTSQILTELHGNDGASLEACIQACPDGMNKLLQRLPDSSREEVRNQAIVLIQQLTSLNEEMKKTVVFNEGFEILFRIIHEEGGSEEAGFVVNDCLRICNNILHGSEICQRLFFTMGNDWILRLADFFNPSMLEKLGLSRFSANDDDQESFCWFDESSRLSCAIFAQMILYNALNRGVNATNHQNRLYERAPMIMSSTAFWIARNGPKELVSVALSFLSAMVSHNPEIGIALSNLQIKLPPPIEGKNIPRGQVVSPLQFSWKPLPNDDRRHISFLSLLAERYIFPVTPWNADHGDCFKNGLDVEYEIREDAVGSSNTPNKNRLDLFCLSLFEKVMSVDSTLCDMTVQYILAPPPPPMLSDDVDDGFMDNYHGQLESMKPLGSILSSLLVNVCDKLLSAAGNHGLGGGFGGSKNELDSSERVVHLLSIIFMHGSQLARELSTAITTSHIRNMSDLKARGHSQPHESEVKSLLPLILASVGKAARLPGGWGYPYVSSVLQLLAIVVTGCERATRQLFEDPSNLFVVDLATSSSEMAGIPPLVQVLACLFLGSCCSGFPAAERSNDAASGTDNTIFSRRAFLSMIDSRIGLNRFNETLKKPLTLLGSKKIAGSNPYDGLFDLPGFKEFYEHQMDAIKTIILELYSGNIGGNSSSASDSIHLEVIATQKAKIQELEQRLASQTTVQQQQPQISTGEIEAMKQRNEELQTKVTALEEQVSLKEEQLIAKETTESNLFTSIKQLEKELATLRQSEQRERDQRLVIANELRIKDASLQDLESIYQESSTALTSCQLECDTLRRQSIILQQEFDFFKQQQANASLNNSASEKKMQEVEEELHKSNQELLRIKENYLQEIAQHKSLQDSMDMKDRKLSLLEDELTALRNSKDSMESSQKQYSVENKRLQDVLRDKESFLNDLQLQLVETQEQLVLLQQQRSKELTIVTTPLPSPSKVAGSSFTCAQTMSSLMDLVYTLEIEDSEEILPFIEKYNTGETHSTNGDNLDELISNALQCCRTTINDAAAVCSDLAEGVAIYDLDGKEGSLLRMIDSCRKVQTKCTVLQDNVVDTKQYDQLIEDLKIQLDEYEENKHQSLGRVEELESMLEELKAANERLTDALDTKILESDELVSTERNKLYAHVQQLNEENAQLQVAVESLRKEIDALNASNESLTTECLAFKNSYDTDSQQWQEQLSDVRIRYSQLEAEKNQVIASLEAQLQDVSHIAGAQYATINEKVASLEEKNASLQVEIEIMEEDIRTKTAKIKEQEAVIQNEHNASSAQQNIADLEVLHSKALDSLRNSLEQTFQVEKDHLQATINQLQSELATNTDLIDSLSKDLDRLKNEKEAIKKDLETAISNNSSLQSELNNLRSNEVNQLEQVTQLSTQNQELETQLEQMKSVLEKEMKNAVDAAEAKAVEEKERDIERLAMIAHLEAEKVSMLKDLQHVQSQLQELEAVAKRHANELEEKISQLSLQNEQLQQSHNEEKESLQESWNQKIETIQMQYAEEKSVAKVEIEKLNLDIENDKKRINQLTQRILDLEEELKSTSDEKVKIQKEKENELIESKKALEHQIEEMITKHKDELNKVKDSIRHEEESKTKHLIAKVMTLQEEKKKLEEKFTAIQQENQKEKEKEHAVNQEDALMIQNLQNTVKSMTVEKDRLKLLVVSKNDEIKHLNQVIVKVQDEYAALKETWEGIAGNKSHPFVLQEQELKRLSDSLNKAHHDLHQKEEELKILTAKVVSKEGEIAGLRENLQLEKKSYDSLSKQYDELYQSSLEQQRKLREVSTAASTTGVKLPQTTDDDIHSSITHASSSNASTPIKSGKKTAGSSVHTEMMISSPMATSQSPSTHDVINSPPPTSSVDILNPAMLATPSPNGGSDRKRAEPPMSVMKTASPAVKDAARLNAEIIRERRRYYELHEQHTDLLSLLAQQEVELSIFRQAVSEKLGDHESREIEQNAQKSVISIYGTYTNFRSQDGF